MTDSKEKWLLEKENTRKTGRHKCPVCGLYEFEQDSSYDICPYCEWEDDGVQGDNHNYRGGANRMSVNDAKAEWEERLKAGYKPVMLFDPDEDDETDE